METTNQTVMDFFAALGFEEIPIEDGLTALSFEDGPEGEYSLITNEEGTMPASLEIPVMLACYTKAGAFLWSTGFKNAMQFKQIWSAGEPYEEKLQAAKRHREELMDPSLLALP
jgi:hypothetical protein